MSRFSLSVLYLPRPLDVVLGYDQPLNEFFLNVSRDGELLYCSLMDETPDKDGAWLALRLAEWSIVLPVAVYQSLTADVMGLSAMLGQTNAQGHHDLAQLTLLQAQLVKMKALQLLPFDLDDTLLAMSVQWLLCPEAERLLVDDDGDVEGPDLVPLRAETLELLLPVSCVPDYAEAPSIPVLSDAELLALLQRLEPEWPAC